MTCDTWFFFLQKSAKSARKVTKSAKKMLKSAQKCRRVSKELDFIVSVLLSAHAKRVGASRMRDLFNLSQSKFIKTTVQNPMLEDEILKEVNNYDLFREAKKRRQEFKYILTYESVIKVAECLKRM